MKQVRKTTLAASVSAALILAAAAPIGAQTDLTIENDGLTLTAGAISSEQVLSIRLRVSGPNGFEYEERLEDSLIQWVPKGELADGWYTWEALAVTVQPGAPMLDIAPPAAPAYDPQAQTQGLDNSQATIGAPDPKAAAAIPAERFYAEEFKSVERRSGSFQVRDGFIVQPEPDSDELSDVTEPGLLGSMASAVVDFVFPSAHAGTCNPSPCDVDGTSDSELVLTADTDGGSGGPWNWEVEVKFDGIFGIGEEFETTEPFRIERGATNDPDSIRIDGVGDVGFGTATPSEPIHIADPVPRIRLEDTTGATDWWIRSDGSGNDFEIGQSATANAPFTIDVGATADSVYIGTGGQVGIGTRTPAADLHVSGFNLKIENGGSDWNLNPGGAGFWINRMAPTNAGGVVKIQNDAFTNSLVVDDTGAGFGTSPTQALHVRRTNNTAQIFVEDTGSLDGQTMFNLRNNGHPKFRLQDASQADVRWEFRTIGTIPFDGFTINKIGSGALEMDLRAGGNVVFGGTVSGGSSREIKEQIEDLDPLDVLEKVENLPIQEWSYIATPEERRIGPMAEDFHALFGLGSDNKHIAPTDMAGVALAAVQALQRENDDLRNRLERLEAQLED